MLTRDFLRGRRRSELSPDELATLEAAVSRVDTIPARKLVSRRGQRMRESTLLLEGFMARHMDARDGYRQLLSYHVPGDFVDLHGYPTRYIDHDVSTITEVKVAIMPHARLDAILATQPHLASMLWFSTLIDTAVHREAIFRIGRLDAMERIAHFLCECHCRMMAVGRAVDGAYDLPLTQQDLGEAVGLTSVHVNRVLRRLREEAFVIVSRGKVQILDLARLRRLGEFDPDYLYLEDGPWQE